MAPELSLTPQTIDRFSSRFPGQVAVQHSGLSAGERFDQWWRIKEGGYGVTIGARRRRLCAPAGPGADSHR